MDLFQQTLSHDPSTQLLVAKTLIGMALIYLSNQ